MSDIKQKQFKPTKAMIEAAQMVFTTMAMVQTVKPIVRGYQKKVLAEHQFIGGHDETDLHVILDPKESWLLNDNDFKVYLDETNEEREKVGLKVDNPEHCPLLVAEHMQIQAEHLLIDSMEPVTKLKAEDIYNLDHYKRMVDITLRLLVPFVKNPLKR